MAHTTRDRAISQLRLQIKNLKRHTKHVIKNAVTQMC